MKLLRDESMEAATGVAASLQCTSRANIVPLQKHFPARMNATRAIILLNLFSVSVDRYLNDSGRIFILNCNEISKEAMGSYYLGRQIELNVYATSHIVIYTKSLKWYDSFGFIWSSYHR